jgi:hypothetical protein
LGKLGQGFTSVDPLEEVDIGDGTVPKSTFVGLPCKVINQSIVGLPPLSETTYSTGHELPKDGS